PGHRLFPPEIARNRSSAGLQPCQEEGRPEGLHYFNWRILERAVQRGYMRVFSTLALAGGMCLALGSQAFADVRITMREGRVSLSAKDATVRQILTEWARVGRTQIVNVERIAGGPITIEFTNVPEAEALDMLLRSLSGYMVAPRAVAIADASNFDRIIVMPTSASPRPA